LAKHLGGNEVRDMEGWQLAEIFKDASEIVAGAMPNGSFRRHHATLKLALCYAALDGRTSITKQDVKTAAASAVGS
jgi:hypothetical protein